MTQMDVLRAVRRAETLTDAMGLEAFGPRFLRRIADLAQAKAVERVPAPTDTAAPTDPAPTAWRLTPLGWNLTRRAPTAKPGVRGAHVVCVRRTPGPPSRRGYGSITQLEDGRWRFRAPAPSRATLGIFDTREEGCTVLEAALRTLARVAPPKGAILFEAFAREVLDEREKAGYRSTDGERNTFKVHMERSTLAALPVSVIRTQDVRAWAKALEGKKAKDFRGDAPRVLSYRTVKRCLSIVSTIFAAAMERGIRDDNPASAVRVRRPANAAATRETWSFLTLEEQDKIEAGPRVGKPPGGVPRSVASEAHRLIALFAIGTGLRQGEQWNLELADLHVADDTPGGPHVMVRFGSKGKPPKNGKIRRVPLFGIGLRAARRWLEVLPSYLTRYRNQSALVFPAQRGSRRVKGRFGNGSRAFGELLAACGIDRHLRWHDLRHTCASSLVGGFWGRTWTLHEVSKMLGHSSIAVTERYAHVGQDFLTRAAAETEGAAPRPAPVVVSAPVAAPPTFPSLEEMRRLVAEADRLDRT